jgi:hypothetical protein
MGSVKHDAVHIYKLAGTAEGPEDNLSFFSPKIGFENFLNACAAGGAVKLREVFFVWVSHDDPRGGTHHLRHEQTARSNSSSQGEEGRGNGMSHRIPS